MLLWAVAALAITAAVAPALASAQSPTEDSAVVRGFEPGTLLADIDVRSGPSGESPSGPVEFHFGGGLGPTYTATVTCLAVSGNTAVIGFVGRLRFFGTDEPVAGLIRVTDAGGPGSGQDIFEGPGAENAGPPTNPLPDCASFPPGTPAYNLFSFAPDDIVVTDAKPLPTSKDQCKHGGWKTYGIFRNQGDCVNYVATGGKNQPGGA
jgi:hypothetical protein